MEDPIEGEKIVLEKLQKIFKDTIVNITPKKIQITFRANGIQYKGNFELNYSGGQLKFTNPCSYLQYTYGKKSPYSTRINANRGKTPCFEPRLVGASADVLQILSTKIRLQIPEHRNITIIDEAEKDGVYISKAKLIRGLPTIYEKYGYESEQVNYIKEQLKKMTVGILYDEIKEIIEEKAKIPSGDNILIINVMKRIPPEDEMIEDSEPPVYISNIVYDKAYDNIYTRVASDTFYLPEKSEFVLVFNENSDVWKGIKDKVQIIHVTDVTELSKILFIQLPDNIREKIISIDDDVGDDEPVLDILNRMKDKDISLTQNVYKYMENYLEKRHQVEILMDMPLNAAHEKYRIGDLSDDVKEKFYEIFNNYFKLIGEDPIYIKDSVYIADVLRVLKNDFPDFHFDKLYILLYNTFGKGKWNNQNGGGKRGRQNKRKTKKRVKRRQGKTLRRK